MAGAALRQVILRRGFRVAAEAPGIRPTSAYFGIGEDDKLSNLDLDSIEDNEWDLMLYVSDRIIKDVKKFTNSESVQPGLVETVFFQNAEYRFKPLPRRIQMFGWERALDEIQYYPQAHSLEVFRVRVAIRKRTTEYSNLRANKGITKANVISRVLGVMRYYPKLDWSKFQSHSLLMNEGHFNKDLGLNEEECANIQWGLQQEFMLKYIPEDIKSCKLLVEYIYENIRSLSSEGDTPADRVYSLACLVIKVADHIISNISSDLDDYARRSILRETLCLIDNLISFKTYPVSDQLSLISTVFDRLQIHPKFNGRMVFYLRRYIRSMLKGEGKDDITKDQIISRILKVLQDYPILKEDRRFYKELGLNEEESMAEMIELQFESWAPDFTTIA